MAQVKTTIWLKDKNWTTLAQLQYQNLQYRRVINGVGQCYFEMQIQNPVFQELNFNFLDNTYNIEIVRDNQTVFKGELDEIKPPDSKAVGALGVMDRVGFYASHKLDHFSRLIANRDTDDLLYKRSFNDVSLGTAAQTLVQEAISKSNSPVSDVTIGTIENPLNEDGTEIKLTSDQALYAENILNWIDFLAVVGNADYWLDESNRFNFVKHKGIRRPNTVFRLHYGEQGNNVSQMQIVNSKREMANKLIVLGAGEGIEKTFVEVSDPNHQNRNLLREKVIPARILDTTSTATKYGNTQLEKSKQVARVVVFTPTQSHIPFDGFELGDEIQVDVDWFIFRFIKWLRVEGLETYIDQQGVESHAYIFSEPQSE